MSWVGWMHTSIPKHGFSLNKKNAATRVLYISIIWHESSEEIRIVWETWQGCYLSLLLDNTVLETSGKIRNVLGSFSCGCDKNTQDRSSLWVQEFIWLTLQSGQVTESSQEQKAVNVYMLWFSSVLPLLHCPGSLPRGWYHPQLRWGVLYQLMQSEQCFTVIYTAM